jgi:hypothetical protein
MFDVQTYQVLEEFDGKVNPRAAIQAASVDGHPSGETTHGWLLAVEMRT